MSITYKMRFSRIFSANHRNQPESKHRISFTINLAPKRRQFFPQMRKNCVNPSCPVFNATDYQ